MLTVACNFAVCSCTLIVSECNRITAWPVCIIDSSLTPEPQTLYSEYWVSLLRGSCDTCSLFLHVLVTVMLNGCYACLKLLGEGGAFVFYSSFILWRSESDAQGLLLFHLSMLGDPRSVLLLHQSPVLWSTPRRTTLHNAPILNVLKPPERMLNM